MSRVARVMDSSQTRDGLPRKRKARDAHNVHECESVCA